MVRMMKKTLVSSIVATVIFSSTAIMAAQPMYQTIKDYYGDGPYVGVDLGYGFDNYGDYYDKAATDYAGPLNVQTTLTKKNAGFTFGANAGYYFNRYAGIELNYLRYPDYKLIANYSVDGVSIGGTTRGLEPGALNFMVTGRLPVGPIALFAQLGYGYMFETLSTQNASVGDHNALAAAAGIAYKINKNIGVNVKWIGDFGGKISATNRGAGNFSAITGGVAYYFY